MKQIAYLSVIVLVLAILTTTIISCNNEGSNEAVDTGDEGVSQAVLTRDEVDDALNFVVERVSECSITSSVAEKVLSYLFASIFSVPGCASSETAERSQGVISSFKEFSHGLNSKILISEISRWIRSTTRDIDPRETFQVGSCGGEIEMNMIDIFNTGKFMGQVVFNDFCHEIGGEEINISNSLSVSGTVEQEGDEITELNISTDSNGIIVHLEDGSYTIVLEDAGFTVEEGVMIISVDSFLLQERTDSTMIEYGNEDLRIRLTEGESFTEVEGSGRFSRPDIGYVDFSIIEPIIISEGGEVVSGKVEITGAGGTKMLVTGLGDNQFQIHADTDGDGTYDYAPGTLNCTGLNLNL